MNFNPLFLLVYGSVNHTYLTAVLLLCCCNLACMSPCLHRLSRSTELFCIKCCFDRLESRGNIWSKEAMDRFYSWHYFCCVDVELTMIDASQLHTSSERGSICFSGCVGVQVAMVDGSQLHVSGDQHVNGSVVYNFPFCGLRSSWCKSRTL
jgi:hypothetical protein